MGTYKLWELTKKGDREVYELAETAAELRAQEPKGHIFGEEDWGEEAQTLVYGIHRVLWSQGNWEPDNDIAPYTHRTVHPTSVKWALRKLLGGKTKTEQILGGSLHVRGVAQGAYAILSQNQLLLRRGQGARQSHFYIREWPKGFMPKWHHYKDSVWLSMKDEADIAAQEKKAVVLAGEVVVYHDVDAIPLPDPNPESVLSYLRKVMPMVRHLQAENTQLREQLKAIEQGEWSSVVSELDTLLHGTEEEDGTTQEST